MVRKATPKNSLEVTDVTDVTPISETADIIAFVDNLVATAGSVDLKDCLRTAVDTVSYLKAVRNKTMVQASCYVPGIIRTFGAKAVQGDMASAKMILDYIGFEEKDSPAQINTQVNVSVPTLKDILTASSKVGDDSD